MKFLALRDAADVFIQPRFDLMPQMYFQSLLKPLFHEAEIRNDAVITDVPSPRLMELPCTNNIARLVGKV